MTTRQLAAGAAGGDAASRSVARRITRVLAALSAADEQGVSGAELARQTGLPTATAHRLLVELEREGVTVRRGTRGWVLGPVVLGWGAAAERQLSGRSRFHDALRAISGATKETVVLTVREGWHGTHVDLVEAPSRLRIVEHIGLRLPLTIGASRRAILGFLPGPERQRVLSRYGPAGAAGELLTRDLRVVAELGFCVSAGEVTAYSVGVAVPLLSQGTASASIMVGGPAARMRAPEVRLALEAIHAFIRPRDMLPPLAMDRAGEELAAAEKHAG